MVQYLQRQPSFKEQLGESIGQGMSQGVDLATQMAMEQLKQQQRMKSIQQVYGQGEQSKGAELSGQQKPSEDLIGMLDQMKREKTGQGLTEEDKAKIPSLMTQFHPQQQRQSPPQKNNEQMARDFAMLGEHDLSRHHTEMAKADVKRSEAEINRGYQESKPTRERGRTLLEELPYKESALENMKSAIESGNLGMFSLDNLAEMTGIEGLRSPEGAAFKTSSKEFFLGNLNRVGSKGLNQMMERVVLEMAPQIGRKPEADLAVSEILEAELDVSRKEAELIHSIGQNYKEKHGYYPDDLADRVYKELRPFAIQRQKDSLSKIDTIKEKYETSNKSGTLMYDPQGNLRRVPHKDIKSAKKEGYRTP